jgi:hypothetical protein
MGGRTLKVYCAALPPRALLAPEVLLRAGLSAAAKVLDLKGRLRCRGCDRKGRAVVSVKWRGRAPNGGGVVPAGTARISGEQPSIPGKEGRRVGGTLATPPARLGPAGS